MCARITSAFVRPERVNEAIMIFRDSILPAYIRRDTCETILLLVDKKNGKVILLSVRDTDGCPELSASGQFGLAHITELIPLFVTRPVEEGYEVAIFQKAARS